MHRQHFGGNDFDLGVFAKGVAVGGESGALGFGNGAVGRPFGGAAQGVADVRAVVDADAGALVDVVQPGKLEARRPVFAFHIGMGFKGGAAAERGRHGGHARTPVGRFAQLGFGVLGDDADADGVFVVNLKRHRRLDGDGFQTQFVQMKAQHRVVAVGGGRAEGHVHAQAQRGALVQAVGAVNVGGEHRAVGDFAAVAAGHLGAAVVVFGGGVAVFDGGQHHIGGDTDFVVFQFGKAGGVVKQGGSVVGFGGGGIGGALRGNRLGAEMVARSGGLLCQRGQG